MKKILIGIGAVLVLLIAAVLIVPMFIPVEVYKAEIVKGIEEATGRKARIDGDFSLALLPRAEFIAGKVSLANAPGGKAENLVSLDRLTVKVAVFPLLSGNLEIDALVVEKPIISLEVDKSGRPNWQFETMQAGVKAPTTPSEPGGAGASLSGISLGDVRLVDGLLTYADMTSGASHRLEGINLKLALASLDSPLKADGSVVWNKEEVKLTSTLAKPNAALAGGTTAVEISLKANPIALGFKGNVTGGPAPAVKGRIDLDVPSVRRLAAWAGSPLDAPGTGLGPLKIAGDIDMKGQVVAFRNAKFGLDEITGEGELSFDGRRTKPFVKASLKLGALNLNPYLPPESAGESKPASGAASGPSDWSDDPIDLSALNAANAELDLAVGGLLVRKIKIGESVLKVTLRDGTLVTDLTKMALYDGIGKAKVTARAGKAANAVSLETSLAGFQANPFMQDAMAIDRIEGKADATASVTTRGRTQRELISAMAGNGKVSFRDGAIKGINLGAMVRNIRSAFLDSGASETQKTDFSEMGGTFQIRQGIVTNNDLLLLSPLLRLTGKGTVDMPQRRIDYRVVPKVVASTTGQGAAAGARGVAVPVIIKGPWHNISYQPDMSAVLEGVVKAPGEALDSVKDLVPGMGGSGSGKEEGSSPSSSPLDQLKGLFGR